jgi:hypothetical protein
MSASAASHDAAMRRAVGTRVAVTHAVPRLWATLPAIAAVPVAVAAQRFGQLGIDQTINYKYMTSVNATGVGASGPPRKREPA